jgi:hypothetical protein
VGKVCIFHVGKTLTKMWIFVGRVGMHPFRTGHWYKI